jgi:hypothetical protein
MGRGIEAFLEVAQAVAKTSYEDFTSGKERLPARGRAEKVVSLDNFTNGVARLQGFVPMAELP